MTTIEVTSLYRYPVKGLSPESLDSVTLTAGSGVPADRVYALLRNDAAFDARAPAWLLKANFLMLMLHPQLAALQTRYVEADDALYLRRGEEKERCFDLTTPAGRLALENFFLGYLPDACEQPPRLVHAAGHQFTDKAAPYVSLINLASVRALEQQWGCAINPLRFRANVYIDGAEPFSELDWVGREVCLGKAKTVAAMRNGRCAATNVNPLTADRDGDIPRRLRRQFGHKDFGIYLRVTDSGVLYPGDAVAVGTEVAGAAVAATAKTLTEDEAALMCSACFYLLDPDDNGQAQQPEQLSPRWRCPDCGASRDAVVVAPRQ